MSRKFQRSILRAEADRQGVKASAYINHKWREKQEKKYGHKIATMLEHIGSGKGKARQKAARRLLPALAPKGGM